jgi:hypothetical protein
VCQRSKEACTGAGGVTGTCSWQHALHQRKLAMWHVMFRKQGPAVMTGVPLPILLLEASWGSHEAGQGTHHSWHTCSCPQPWLPAANSSQHSRRTQELLLCGLWGNDHPLTCLTCTLA